MNFHSRYEDSYRNWRKFAVWKKLYEDNEKNFLDEIKEIKKCNGSTAGKPIHSVSRFEEYFDLLPVGCYTYCTIPVTYFKQIHKVEWENLIKKLKRYKKGDGNFNEIFDYLDDEESDE